MAKEKILVIEDNPVIVRLNESLLSSSNYQMIHAADGASGIRKAMEEHPDIILLDIILPEMHGFEVCQQLKKDEQTRKIPVVIVSGTGLENIVEKEPEIQADAYLSKPYGLPELLAAIKRAQEKIKKSSEA